VIEPPQKMFFPTDHSVEETGMGTTKEAGRVLSGTKRN